MELPQSFAVQMKQELGGEWDAFLTACQEKPCRGYRLNHAKMTQIDRQNNRTVDPETAGTETPDARVAGILSGESVAWCASGRYLREESGKETYPISKHPLHYAGAYYIQEPSAMLPAAMLHACPGDRVLDLCAAPGGKSTQLIDDMEDCGLLISNDISASRGKAIVRNLERFGKARILVTAEEPEKLARVFPEYFDKILVDAPCSGEGMFRREPSMREEWLKKGPDFYAPIQREILSQAVKMLRPGGRIVYSTCTFCKQEDEENVAWLLNEYPEFTLVEDKKLMPHRCKGEGQYAALMEKAADGTADRSACGLTDCLMSDWAELTGGSKLTNRKAKKPIGNFKEKGNEAVLDFFRLTGMNWDTDRWYERDGQLYELPVDIGPMKSLRFLRTGLWLGEIKKGRFEPSQALAMYLKKDQFANTVDFAWEDERVVRYLKGETIEAEGAFHLGKDGWCLVLAGGLPLGWAKRSGETLKNKYEPGWRMQ